MFEDEFAEEIIDADGTMEDEEAALRQHDEEKMTQGNPEQQAWIPGVNTLASDEVLEFDPSAYALYHKMKVEWPSLSFNILPDALGSWRSVSKPSTVYAVTGSQAEDADKNTVSILKMYNLKRMEKDNEDGFNMDSDSDDDDEDDLISGNDPIVDARSFKHNGTVNRIRACPRRPEIVATWSDTGNVYAWDISPYANALENSQPAPATNNPLYTFNGHTQEGYALDWSNVDNNTLASGSCDGTIYTHVLAEDAMKLAGSVMAGHAASVEDIQWAKNEGTVFASCSVDRTIRIWDTRQRARAVYTVLAHDTDVNVISWNTLTSNLLASGGDDGSLKIWDLRVFGQPKPAPIALFQWHKKAITSIEWHPQEDSVLACSSEDNSITVWDMGLEADADEVAKEATGAKVDYNIPPQLLFIHLGQEHIKELHFHPQIPSLILSTASDGIDIFKAANLDVLLPPSVENAVTATN